MLTLPFLAALIVSPVAASSGEPEPPASNTQRGASLLGAQTAAEQAAVISSTEAALRKTRALQTLADSDKTPEDYKKALAGAGFSLVPEIKKYGWGVGAGPIFMSGDRPVTETSLDDARILRVETASDVRIGGFLEGHFLFSELLEEPDVYKPAVQLVAASEVINELPIKKDVAFGLVAAFEVGGEDTVRSFGFGGMISMRNYTVEKNGSNTIVYKRMAPAFNVSVMYIVEPNVKTLVPGLEDGMVVPDGVSNFTREEANYGIALMMSAGF